MKTVFITLILGIFLNTPFCKAQSMSFQINSIGHTPNMTVSSLSFQFETISNCLFVGNGLAIYQSKSTSAPFRLDCIIPFAFEQNGLKIFPNPVGNSPKIQFIKKNLTNTLFTIRIYNVEGKLVLEETRNGFALSTGILLNTSRLISGNYLVQVLSANSVDLLRIIKQN